MNILLKIISFFHSLTLSKEDRETFRSVDKFMADYRKIELTTNGFLIKDIKGKVKQELNWDEVKDAVYYNDHVLLKLNGGKHLELFEEKYDNWYELIKNMPKGFTGYNYQKVDAFFQSLKGCEVCGLMAVNSKNNCLVCGQEVWNSELAAEYASKEEYLKESQMDFFEPEDENNLNEINNKPKAGFDSYDNWKPLVSASDYDT